MKSSIIRIVFTLLSTAVLSSSLPVELAAVPKLCPIFEKGTLKFDDLSPGPLSTYNGFRFPGFVDWLIVSGSPRSSTPYYKGITSSPHGLLSAFHWMTWFDGGGAFTFDLDLQIVGYRAGETTPAGKKVVRVRNAAGKGGAVNIVLGGSKWRGLDRVGIEAEELDRPQGVPLPGDVSPGFVLDDVVYAKRKLCE
ncbi:hypothetical protein BZA05DRAFT_382347 [Tricharina praecox]|uniref:uncharacterized protein n=1 Tax=Tricharina praecox TaxID=43433 RepID=UPI0022206E45|nr:uncharacterized protein BZA05DRAFT_382347 [Tricharina praecox]KAI5858756.1 hypothetical protein BZA05DRAFT_382347 [Tricharina praecox]